MMEKAGGLEPFLNSYMNANFFSKDDPAINKHRFNITPKQYNEETHNIYNIDKTKTHNIKHNRYTDEHYYNTAQNVNNNFTNNISKRISLIMIIFNSFFKKHSKNYISNSFKSQTAYVENSLFKRPGNQTFNNTSNKSNNMNQYTTDVVNSCKINKVSNLKKAYYDFIDDVVINTHNTIYTNGNITVTKINKHVNFNGNNYFTKIMEHTDITTNNITRHNHNNYEHNVTKKVYEHIRDINSFDTEVNYLKQKSLNKKNYYNFYHDIINFRMK